MFAAIDPSNPDKTCVVKLGTYLPDTKKHMAQFEKEAKTLEVLSNQRCLSRLNIPRLLGYSVLEYPPVIAEEYVDGVTLADQRSIL